MSGLLLAGGRLVDGTGSPPIRADVWVRDGVVARIAPEIDPRSINPDTGVRDVSGRLVCPGFVDIHTHSDLTLLSNPQAPSKIHQGVTTEVVGNCGLGVAPLMASTDIPSLRAAVSYLDLDPAIRWSWRDTAGHLDALRAAGTSPNVATLTAHIPLRVATVGLAARRASRGELDRMRGLLRSSFDQGSLGLSTGLMYPPACFADDDELVALGIEVAAAGRVFAWHLRDYSDSLVPSVAQALRIAEITGCHTQISHLAALGRRNWGSVLRALELVDRARSTGLQVNVDAYPYLHGNAPLVQLLPSWVQEGDAADLAARLREPGVRRQVRDAWRDRPTGWDEIAISRLAAGAADDIVPGETVSHIASRTNQDPDEVALDLLAELGSSVMMIAGGRSDDDMRAVLSHPATVVASDGLSLDPNGVTGEGAPHPRSYGCFPRYLTRVAGQSDAEVGEGVRRCTSAPAAAIGLPDRGQLKVGAPADIVIIDPHGLTDCATFEQPQRFPAGVDLVMVAGVAVVDTGRHTGARPGRVLSDTNRPVQAAATVPDSAG